MTYQYVTETGPVVYNTGIWTYRATTLTNFTVGDKYIAEVSHASQIRPVTFEFQYGEHEGDDGRNFLSRGPELSAAVGANTITLAAAAPGTLNFYNGCVVKIVDGTGEGQARVIHHYTAARVCHVDPWTTALDATSRYVILPKSDESFIVNSGMATAGTGTSISLALTAEAVVDNTYNGNMVVITGGLGVGQSRIISSYDATGGATERLATVSSAWVTNPDATSTYVIFPLSASGVVGLVWDELMAGHVGAGTTGGNLDALGTALDARTNNANLNALLGVPDEANATAGVVHVAGTADAGSTALLIVDAARTEADTDYWTESIVFMTSGPNAGQGRRITAFDPATDTMTVSPAFTQAVAAGNTYIILKSALAGDVAIAAADILAIADAVWDENIVAAHGAVSSAGLLVRALGAGISTRLNNATLNALLGVADAAGADVPSATWDEDVTTHVTASTGGLLMTVLGNAISTRANNANLNALLGVADQPLYDIAYTIWDENVVTLHTAASSAGLLLSVLGTGISTRANNASLDALLGVADQPLYDIAYTIWDEDIVTLHAAVSSSGLLLRVLGAAISTRANNATLNALLGVDDTAGHDVPFEVWEEVLGGLHIVPSSSGERLKAIDDLTQVGGAGDLTYTLGQVTKIDQAATDSPPTHGSLADDLDDIAALVTASATAFVIAVNVDGTTLHLEIGKEVFGLMDTTAGSQCSAQIFNEAGGIERTIGVGDFGAIGARGMFKYDWASHTLLAGKTYEMTISLTYPPLALVTTTKVFTMLSI
jgi:hypothetical protein